MKKERKNMTLILSEYGWAYYQIGRVEIQGKNRTAFAIEENPWNYEGIKPAKYEDLSAEIKKNFKHVWEGKSHSEYAPEIHKNWVAAW
jgi:hypothetical protein